MRSKLVLFAFLIVGFTAGRALAAPDVLGDPLGFADRVSALWKSGAITGAVILGAFGALVVLRTRFAWLREGHRAVWISAAIGGLSMLAERVAAGETPNLSMMMVTACTTLTLAVNPKHEPTPGGAA